MSKTNDEVYGVVRKHLLEICPDIAPDTVARGESMKALGASSLDMVEVVSCSMRELGVRIARQELSDIKDIGGLVDLLHAAVLKKVA
jgi:acyl carrier protein